MSNIMPAPFARQLYYHMARIRQFENRVVTLVDDNEIAGVCHEYTGQEAVAVGICGALAASDIVTSTHRGHGHTLAKGGDVGRMFAELLARTTGYNQGRGGSMHIADVGLGIFGANGIVGAGTPIACGAAHKFKAARENRVAVSFFGDGAINQGVVHEAMNLAAIWQLPVIFVCENNQYAISTPLKEVTVLAPHVRAQSYGMPSVAVDGMDVEAVYHAAIAATERARSGEGPTFIECLTYRYFGHYTGERHMKMNYRSQDELESWKLKDPIKNWATRMLESGFCTQEDIEAVDVEVAAEIERGVEFARNSPHPNPADALDCMYAVSYPNTPAWGVES
ncbi:thiamine pyrophosphate-dependent dehydrogenase E1 component subunit alpha [Mesorhizobium sp.]|uniref:thiamine pyrophosphate-dependent dehydrogenase E1 component subunit alpha n=1 Tax=Mesorhizobium sp. TaxID=1871066 RepID=UPI002580A209|nr:thiamine pyrophosphate-dependent dehydrogenase E1 component subunit alpha [Mesorhizobium sp.]